ncbi:MAG TPA: M15 family metallopeptidase [Nocardioidaceae bacterium]|nr:M15 family metallopeptidase [Nocardioidaceae bacterium]
MRRTSDARLRRALAAATALAATATLGGCGSRGDELERTSSPTGSATPGAPDMSTPNPGSLEGPTLTSDVLITSTRPIADSVVKGLRGIKGVRGVERLSIGSLSVEGRTLTVAAVDPASYRRFTPDQTARADEVWARVAGGEVAVDPDVARKVVSADDQLALSDAEDADTIHVGAYAPLTKSFSAVVNYKRGEQLGMVEGNAVLVSTGLFTPSALAKDMKRVIGAGAALRILALEFDVDAVQTAVLTGGSVSSAVGSFSYRQGPNGTIQPDAAWVSAYIRTEVVPILGNVTCNKAMLPQLRAALTEIVQRGLAGKIHPDEYAGCYYPRYIGRDPANGLSLHSWGIALDLNVPGNQRGTIGEMDRQVVAIFKKWGFAWGGDWSYTDPMHFEMNRVVSVG